MGYGIEIKNSSGNVIVDGEYKNFALYASGTATLPAVGGVTTVAFTATDQIPLIAIRNQSTAQYVSLWGIRKTGSNYDGFYLIKANAVSYDVDWRVYTAHPAVVAQDYGMRVHDAAGAILFDSGRNYFDIFQLNSSISLSTPQLTEDAAGLYSDISHVSVEDPFYFVSPSGYWVFQAGGPRQFRAWRIGVKKINSTSVRLGWHIIRAAQTPPLYPDENGGWNPTVNLMVIK